MKLYGAPNPAPNPRRVRIAIAEKAIDLVEIAIDLRARGHKAPEHLARNPAGQVPTLVLDDGRTLSESVSICRYLDALYPAPPLFGGSDAFAAAETDQWIRRVEFVLMTPVAGFWRHAHPLTAPLLTQYRDYGESNRAGVAAAMRWFDRQLAGRDWLAGAFGMADICLLTTVDFAAWIGLAMPDDCPALAAWHARMAARPSTLA